MTLAKKNRRRIVVEGQEYYWAASGQDGYINLRVMVDVDGCQHLVCYFDYHHHQVPQEDGSVALRQQLVVTPYIVRQVIEYGVAHGWTPLKAGGELRLGHLDKEVDLRLNRDRPDNSLTPA